VELPAAHAREHVAHAIVVTHLGVLVGDARIARLLRPKASLLNPLRVVRDEHAAAARGDDLVAVERERADRPERADLTPLVERPSGLGGVLEHRNVVTGARGEDGVEVRALAIEVDDHHGARELVLRGALAEHAIEELRIEIPARAIAVDKYRPRAEVD